MSIASINLHGTSKRLMGLTFSLSVGWMIVPTPGAFSMGQTWNFLREEGISREEKVLFINGSSHALLILSSR